MIEIGTYFDDDATVLASVSGTGEAGPWTLKVVSMADAELDLLGGGQRMVLWDDATRGWVFVRASATEVLVAEVEAGTCDPFEAQQQVVAVIEAAVRSALAQRPV